jgi:hypothetical protein
MKARRGDVPVSGIVGEVTQHLIPGCFVVPAMVGEISRLGLKGYPMVFVPKEF